ncbi:TadE family type IV pilus minor pilin [Georgenia ruanii]|uniref:TadE family type IV pilus minor pilin n=1 Tax=Georgenia ruanii TaxID=348442 RepID=UPI001264930E|nr:TadE family type IV pilus minor pilin [Georgenia ruanii]
MTAELAVALPGVVLLLLVLLTAASAALTQVRVADAARAGARAAALGEPAGQVSAVAAHLAGRGVAVHVGREGGYVVVEVARDLPGPLAVAGLRASATARALPEPGEQG